METIGRFLMDEARLPVAGFGTAVILSKNEDVHWLTVHVKLSLLRTPPFRP